MWMHGTSSAHLDSIRLYGLIPNPNQRRYTPEVSKGISSWHGVYLSTLLSDAIESGFGAMEHFGGVPVIFVCKPYLDQCTYDEDNILLKLLNDVHWLRDNHPTELRAAYSALREGKDDSPCVSNMKRAFRLRTMAKDFGSPFSIAAESMLRILLKLKLEDIHLGEIDGDLLRELQHGLENVLESTKGFAGGQTRIRSLTPIQYGDMQAYKFDRDAWSFHPVDHDGDKVFLERLEFALRYFDAGTYSFGTNYYSLR